MKILHIVPGLEEGGNGIAVAAKMIAVEQGGELIDCSDCSIVRLRGYDEVWVHSMWLPKTLRACWKVIRAGKKLVRMTHANLDPVRYHYHGWKKRLVAPIERWLFKHTDRVVVTCEAEKKWCQEWGLENEFEILDLKKFFNLEGFGDQTKAPPRGALTEYRVSHRSDFRSVRLRTDTATLHLLYLGRRHPLKGVEFLERAVTELNHHCTPTPMTYTSFSLRIVSDHFGEELERDWEWCDVLVLPTLSENFGRVVAEALERGKRVITTDGAPAWEPEEVAGGRWLVVGSSKVGIAYHGRLIYLKGFRDGTDEERVRLLKEAIATLV